MQALQQKTEKAIGLFANLVKNANRDFTHHVKEFDKKIQLPTFMKGN